MIDTAFLDRFHAYIPGWEIPKMRPEFFTNQYGLIVDYLAEFMREMRKHSFGDAIERFFKLGNMSERSIVLTEATDDSERSRQIRSRLSADGRRFEVFPVGKDGHTAVSSDKPLSAEDLFARVDAMPMRQDEMRRGR